MMKLNDVMETADAWLDSWYEWRQAKKWSKKLHPAWLTFATQRKRPEIRETYRKKVLEAYRNKR